MYYTKWSPLLLVTEIRLYFVLLLQIILQRVSRKTVCK